jgi:hypothetical protein
MPWHPPIPAGIATNPAVQHMRFKTALQLLLYCYDDVQRSGWVNVNLKEAAGELGEPYETVRRWWRELREGPFFTELQDHGRKGWAARFSDEWVDWHVLSNNFERSPMNGKPENVIVSSTFERSPMNDDAVSIRYSDRSEEKHTQEREREDRDRTARSLSPAVEIYKQAFPQVRLSKKQEDFITNLVGEGVEQFNCWRAVVEDYEVTPRWRPENLPNLKSRFQNKLDEQSKRRTNGTSKPVRQGARSDPEWQDWAETDLDKPF